MTPSSTIRANYPVTGSVRRGFNKGKRENEWFIVICSRCRQNLKFGDLTLLFCGVRQRDARKFEQHECLSLFFFFFLSNYILALWSCRSRSRGLCINCVIAVVPLGQKLVSCKPFSMIFGSLETYS